VSATGIHAFDDWLLTVAVIKLPSALIYY